MLILSNFSIEESVNFEPTDEELEEAKISVMKRGLGSKRAALAGSTAMQIARQKNPAMFRM